MYIYHTVAEFLITKVVYDLCDNVTMPLKVSKKKWRE